MVDRAKSMGMKALGLTDHGAMYGAVEFYTACKEAGIKPIIGCELYVASGDRFSRTPSEKTSHHLTVLAQNNVGYQNLIKLVTKANLEGFYYKPRVDHELLTQHADGLIVLSGCPSAEVPVALMEGDDRKAEELIRWYRDTFPSFYIEVQRHDNLEFLDGLNSGLLNLAERLDIPLIATNDLHYTSPEEATLHDVLLCIGTNATTSDTERFKFSDDSYYLKSEEEMAALFEDIPEAISNTEIIADSVNIELDFSTLHLPQYKAPDGEDADRYLRRLCWQGFESRYPSGGSTEANERLTYELDVITQTQYPNYFLVVWDIADYARRNDIVFGVRGSAASSLALYCLGVTEIDPLEYRLVFERFLNIERKEMPDIDMDFQDDRRGEAIRYVVDKYGKDHVAQIITFGTLGAKAAIRDAGRALGMTYGEVDRVARLIPTRLGMSISTALEESQELSEAARDPVLGKLIQTARGIEGVTRHASTHAAGVVISEEPLTEHVPLQRPTRAEDDGVAMTQYPMEPLAKLGMLKMDFLGLINYSILANAQRLIQERSGVEIRLSEITFDDPKTYHLLGSGETSAIFQLESAGMRRYIKELKPNNLGELAAMVALYRPGPMEHISTFIDSKFGKVPIQYPHPDLEEILRETYGVIVYQDQVLHILRRFAGYSLGEADIVRKAMGKKIATLMQQEREKFIDGAATLGYERHTAEAVFDLIEPFAGYAFNKAHSVSYAVIAYWTAFFKANFPVEFMTCVLNAYTGNSEKTSAAINECSRLGIKVFPPCVSQSDVDFRAVPGFDQENAIRFGLATIKNVGEGAVARLVEERRENGPFSSLDDFIRRGGPEVANRRVLESLISVGAMDSIGTRGRLLASVEELVHSIQREAELKSSGQSTMFDLFGASMPTPMAKVELREAVEPTSREQALWERELLGVSLSSKPLDPNLAPDGAILSKDQLESEPEGTKVTIVGRIGSVRLQVDRQQRRIAFAGLEIFDGATIDVAVWARAYESTSSVWEEGNLVEIYGPVRRRNDEVSVHCDQASVFALPLEITEDPIPPEVREPRLESWNPGAKTESTSDTSPNLETSGRSLMSLPNQPLSEQPAETANELAIERYPDIPQDDGVASTGQSGSAQSRKILVNLTETNEPAEDQHLLQTVLRAMLDYDGVDTVALLIWSDGKRWRLEMPIITTHFCDELSERITEILGTPNAVTIEEQAIPVPIS